MPRKLIFFFFFSRYKFRSCANNSAFLPPHILFSPNMYVQWIYCINILQPLSSSLNANIHCSWKRAKRFSFWWIKNWFDKIELINQSPYQNRKKYNKLDWLHMHNHGTMQWCSCSILMFKLGCGEAFALFFLEMVEW